jgi:hypothetical protein
MSWGLAVVVLALLAGGAAAQPAAEALGALGKGDSTAALAGNLRALVLKALPQPLHEDHRHWGAQRPGRGGKPRNDGRWWRVRAEAINPADTLVLDLRDVRKSAPGQTLFTAHLALDARLFLDRQTWRAGVRLYSGSTRARLRVKLTVRCEATTRVRPNGTFLPDATFRLRVLESDVRYDNLVVEHTAGVGGEAAKLLGDTLVGAAHRFRPSLERDLLAKANAAVVKAGDTREVRLGLTPLLGGKGEPEKKAPSAPGAAPSAPGTPNR